MDLTVGHFVLQEMTHLDTSPVTAMVTLSAWMVLPIPRQTAHSVL